MNFVYFIGEQYADVKGGMLMWEGDRIQISEQWIDSSAIHPNNMVIS